MTHPGQGGADVFDIGSEVDDVGFLFLIEAARVDEFIPGGRVIEAAGADLVGDAVVVDFADTRGVIAVVFEKLRERDDVREVFADGHAVAVNLRGVRAEAAEEGGAAGVAERILAIGAVKADALFGEAIDVRAI